jgi:hypothetical protein
VRVSLTQGGNIREVRVVDDDYVKGRGILLQVERVETAG